MILHTKVPSSSRLSIAYRKLRIDRDLSLFGICESLSAFSAFNAFLENVHFLY